MTTIKIEGTQDTPTVILDKSAGIFEFSGRSLPEDAAGFYKPIIDWLEGYKSAPNGETEFHVKLEYFNTASSKLLLDVLSRLEDIPNTKIVWHFFEDDEDMKEAGEEFSELVEVPFDYKSI